MNAMLTKTYDSQTLVEKPIKSSQLNRNNFSFVQPSRCPLIERQSSQEAMMSTNEVQLKSY